MTYLRERTSRIVRSDPRETSALVIVHAMRFIDPFIYQLSHDVRSKIAEERTDSRSGLPIVRHDDVTVIVQNDAEQFAAIASP